jgi:NTP pyrophosphatase (non-canonical NTP hydrolase)
LGSHGGEGILADSIQELTARIKTFCEARDWDQFHGPKDLAIGVITEASELLEHFRFLSESEALALMQDPVRKEKIEDEVADVLFFLLRFSQRFDIDLSEALVRKMQKIEEKYPVEKSKGSNRKYTEL